MDSTISGSLALVAGGLFPSPLGFGLGSFFLARLVCLVPARGLPGIGKVCWNKILLGESAGEPRAPFVGVVGPGVYPRVGGGTFPRDERLTMVIFVYTKYERVLTSSKSLLPGVVHLL